MIQLIETPIVIGEIQEATHGMFPLTVPGVARLDSVMTFPDGLVVSSDGEVRRSLAATLGRCGLTAIAVETVAESRRLLSQKKPGVVLCEDRLADGEYEDIARLLRDRVPVIVVSSTGDWPEYMKAMTAGVFDYLAYPPIPGELQRVVRNALRLGTNGHANLEGPVSSPRRKRGAVA